MNATSPSVDPNFAVADTALKESAAASDLRPRIKLLATRFGISALIVAVLAAGVTFGHHYWTVGRFVESTDDAYVQADSSTIAPKVSGYVASVLVDDNQPVRAGEVLARIDSRDLQTALDEADASVAAAKDSIVNLTAQLAVQQSVIKQADANVSVAKTARALAKRNEERRQEMAKVGYGSDEQSDDASADYVEKAALVAREEAAAATASRQVGVINSQKALADAELAHALAVRHQAALNLSYATIRAPIDGTVGARSIRVGQYVQAGTQLMELVPLRRTYVVANFKETQLTNMRAGDTARIAVDAFPNHELVARVASLAPASGLEFSLLPPDNATGNFTKIVQRVPVKLLIDNDGQLLGRLRPGMSVTVSVDTKPSATNSGVGAGTAG
ncbi:MAG: HlyD family secretion protein [Steroidobacteraceae bacterium]|jgi:membrane fusion protein (multidrug efflux system)